MESRDKGNREISELFLISATAVPVKVKGAILVPG
jgi:hypothetical protein